MYLILLALLSFTDIPDGSLLFVEGGNQIVMDFTDSPYSHAAIIFNEKGKPYVYEAVKPVCRKISLEDYIKEIEALNDRKDKNMKIWIRKPKSLKPELAANMKEYCEKQIGRKYKIGSYLSGKPKKGIHCGEMTTRAIIAGGMFISDNPCKQSPKDIMEFSSKWYEKPILFGLY
jgi:hypothetical protein